jgi:F-type H+-transporting ATPase subunit a
LKLVKVGGIAVIVIALIGVGLIVAKGPQPEIVVPAEVLWKAGPLNITNTMLTAWVVMAFLVILSLLATRSMSLMPGGLQNFVEAAIGFLVDQVENIAGEAKGRVFFTVIATIFLFVLVSNWFGLLPFFNAIGKSEDIGHEIFHEIEVHAAEGKGFEKEEDFAGWIMDGSSSFIYTKPNAKDADFVIPAGSSAGAAADKYVVFLAETFAGYKRAEGASEELVTPEEVREAAAILERTADAPKLLIADEAAEHGTEGEGEAAHEGVVSPALGVTITGINFEDSQKFALVIPYFRGVYSDVNNTLALGIIAFFMIEFWGFKFLGFGYLGKFFVAPWKSPIGTFVGLLELLSEFIRIISFTFRLFGNIFAGEVLVLMLTFLMPFVLVDLIYGLELFVGFIQASVFALLTLVFAVMATEHHGEDEHHEGHHDEDASADAHHHTGAAQAH